MSACGVSVHVGAQTGVDSPSGHLASAGKPEHRHYNICLASNCLQGPQMNADITTEP